MNKKQGEASWNAHIRKVNKERLEKEVKNLLQHRDEVRIDHQMQCGRVNKRLQSDVKGNYYVIHNHKQILKTKNPMKAIKKYDNL